MGRPAMDRREKTDVRNRSSAATEVADTQARHGIAVHGRTREIKTSLGLVVVSERHHAKIGLDALGRARLGGGGTVGGFERRVVFDGSRGAGCWRRK